LIVVDAGFPLQTRDRLNSLTSVSNQALAILVRRDVERQRTSLTSKDLLIQPTLAGRSSYDFTAVPDAISAGEFSARAALPQLTQLAAAAAPLTPAPALVQAPAAAGPPTIEFITTEAGSARYEKVLQTTFADQLGKPLDAGLIAQRLGVLYGSGNFQVLDFHVGQSPQGTDGLVFTAHRNSWGPNYLRLGLSLQDDFEGNSTFNAAARAAFTDLNSLGAEALLDLRVGASPLVGAEFYQPLSMRRSYCVRRRTMCRSLRMARSSANTGSGTLSMGSIWGANSATGASCVAESSTAGAVPTSGSGTSACRRSIFTRPPCSSASATIAWTVPISRATARL
jgi:NTE family protein